MAISLMCECGARLEIDDTFAGQTISCPDCQRALKAPAATRTAQRTSGFALTSLLLVLIGAFTVVGTALAVIFGGLALWQISRQRDRITGSAYAMAGIVLGVLLTGFSIFAYSSVELFGIGRLMVEAQWAGKLDYPPSDEVVRKDFSIRRPSKAWGVYREAPLHSFPGHFDNALEDALLVNVVEDAHILCLAKRISIDWEREAIQEFRTNDRVEFFGRKKRGVQPTRFEVRSTKRLPQADGIDTVEMLIEKSMSGQQRQFILRVHKRRGDVMMYIVAAGARQSNFERLEPQLRQALDSFRILDLGFRDWP
jgi:hypothetical protein